MTAFRNSYGYDANGNQVTRNGNTLTYASYNLPTWIAMGTNSSTLSYGAWRNLARQVAISSAGAETTIYVAGLLEKVTRGSITEYRHLIGATPGTVAVYIRQSSGSNATYYLHRDHLGSPELITDAAGAAVVNLSFSAYGERRDADWDGPISSAHLALAAGVTRHGYTDHQELDSVNLIHMNGRVYDPVIGRFQTRDPYIDGIDSSQGSNGYAYVWNNPLSATDPTGYDLVVVVERSRWRRGGNSSGFGHMVSGVGGGGGGHSHANMGGPWPFVEDNNGMENVIVTGSQDQPPPSSPYTAIGSQGNPCPAQTPLTLGQANQLFRNNTSLNTTVTEDARQLSVKQSEPFSSNGNALGSIEGVNPAAPGSWYVHGTVTLHQDSGGNVTMLPDTYSFLPHSVSFSDPHWFREAVRNVETYAGFYIATYGGLTEYWADVTGGNHATDFTSTFCGNPTVHH